jgi:sugar phosphate isomerase/epimerase
MDLIDLIMIFSDDDWKTVNEKYETDLTEEEWKALQKEQYALLGYNRKTGKFKRTVIDENHEALRKMIKIQEKIKGKKMVEMEKKYRKIIEDNEEWQAADKEYDATKEAADILGKKRQKKQKVFDKKVEKYSIKRRQNE